MTDFHYWDDIRAEQPDGDDDALAARTEAWISASDLRSRGEGFAAGDAISVDEIRAEGRAEVGSGAPGAGDGRQRATLAPRARKCDWLIRPSPGREDEGCQPKRALRNALVLPIASTA